MKKIIVLLFAVSFLLFACGTKQGSPGAGPQITLEIPELFTPDPDDANIKITIGINLTTPHPVPIKDWSIQINPARGPRQTEQERTGTGRRREFFQYSRTGALPRSWDWNGRGVNNELVQSATNYQFTLSVNDILNNNTTVTGIISTGIIVIREGDKLRMVVPSIIFPANLSDLALVTDEDDRRNNARVLREIARALGRFDGYRITVEGHANPTTRPNTAARTNENPILRRLSLDRAQAVINFLVTEHSITRARLSPIGIGGDRTVAPWDNTEENWKNRRVEFILER